jgi:exopolysaccharide biosynthesis predicted pyruvyltransferase EpsI
MKRLFWVNCFPPSFHNVGDHAMTLAIQKFLSDHFNDYRIIRFYRPEIERFLKEKLSPDDLIFIHSSGDFGDLYVNGPKLRKRVISAFPDNRIVQLPVSVHYENPASFEADTRFFSGRPNLLILCRSKEGAKLLADNFGCQVRFFPDFTFYLKPRRNRSKREGVLFVLRSDRESNFKGVFLRLTEKLTTPFRIFKRIFRKDILFVSTQLSRSADMRLLAWRIKAIFNDATVCDPQIADVDLTDENRESYILSVLDFYGKFRVVVTDRFHGLVFARLAGTKAISIPSRIEKKAIIENEDYTPYFRDFRKLVFDYPRKKQIGRS